MRRPALLALLVIAAAVGAAVVRAQDPPRSEDALRKEIEALRAPGARGGAIAWERCLLEALARARAEKKPLALLVRGDPRMGAPRVPLTAEAIALVSSSFVPLVLEAPALRRPDMPDGSAEGHLLRAIEATSRGPLPPLGLFVLDDRARVLAWALSFGEAKDTARFLEHGAALVARAARRTTERYGSYPDAPLDDAPLEPDASASALPAGHEPGEPCFSRLLPPRGTIALRVVGRAVSARGGLVPVTTDPGSYAEEDVLLPFELSSLLVEGQARAPGSVPRELARFLATVAHLGPPVHGGDLDATDLAVERVAGGLRLHGHTLFKAEAGPPGGTPSRLSTALGWEGYLAVEGSRITRLVLVASGSETVDAAERVETGARFGIVGEPVPDADSAVEPAEILHIRGKLEPVQAGLERWKRSGLDTSEIDRTMRVDFQRNMRDGRFAEAEATLDRVLATLATDGKAPVPEAEARVQEKLAKVHQAALALVAKGKAKEAEAILDRALSGVGEGGR